VAEECGGKTKGVSKTLSARHGSQITAKGFCAVTGADAMSMSHKAYVFDWNTFCGDELFQLLPAALESQEPPGLIRYIEQHRELLKDADGEALGEDWYDRLVNLDVHEFGDVALTRFYDPTADYGIGHSW